MRPLLVVLPPPGLDRLTRIPQTQEPLLAQTLVAELPIQALDERVLHRLAGLVRLLFDQNLAASLVQWLADLYPGSHHVREVGLGSADDVAVWAYAAKHGLTIVSSAITPMKTRLVRIGNSRGIRLPKPVIEEARALAVLQEMFAP
jgi:Domain of unknown function (DUF5615)